MSGPAGFGRERLLLDVLAVLVPVVVVLLSETDQAWALPAALVACAGLVLRHRCPLLSLLLCLPGLVGGLAWAPTCVALFRLGRAWSNTWWLLCWALLAASSAFLPVAVQQWRLLSAASLTMAAVTALVCAGVPTAMGTLLATRAQLTASLDRLRAATESELLAKEGAARAEERSRIAREIHDAVGHHVTLIAVEAAALHASSEQAEVRASATRVRELAKEALGEMRSTLGLAADQRDSTSARAIPELVARARRSGIRVTLSDECSQAVQLSPGASRAVYRVVQEALTNVSKHAPGAAVVVELTGDDELLRVVVRNGAPVLGARAGVLGARAGAVGDAPDVGCGGSGLAGLSERVRMLGGTLDAVPSDEGFELRAEIPLSPAA
ncbi:sensor histidine kinase [Saccharopolyspora sp. 6V]|uniref:sensor histidine kinase n=1 Tax=Saccharopolyspora sp. 6V TaxID=2877239 RepID=UPI001CD56D52|nr:histidine kinase [Saccharopolyspora sp. 6V]MCA1193433.1 histidine kinase [Saccharopolyspora sp. 6V]